MSSSPPSSSARNCPSDHDLQAVLLAPAGDPVLQRIAAHLESCLPCRQRLDRLAEVEALQIPVGIAQPSPDAPAVQRLMARWRTLPAGQASAEDSASSIDDEGTLEVSDQPGVLGLFAGYPVLTRIASGGMGIVYQALDPALNRLVAIKVLSPQLASSETARARFLREARAAAAVVHESVVAIHAVGEERGLPYLVMQFIAGKSLEARVAQGPLSLREILRIGMQTALGLAAAHAQGLIHRDVKPGNILLENGVERVKLTDFGLARAVDEPGVTRAGVLAGTPEFMSPEQARGERLTPRSDLFSLGAVLHFIATGQSPFRAETTLATLRRVCEDTPARLDRLNPLLPAWLADLVLRLLAKAPEHRYSTALEVAAELQSRLEQTQTDDDPDPRGTALTKPSQDLPTLDGRALPTTRARALALFALLLLLSALAVKWWGRSGSTPGKPTPARSPDVALLRVSTDGHTESFPTLPAALARAAPHDILELTFDGPLVVSPVSLRGVPLTLRAQPPFRPQLINASTSAPLLTTDASLALEGIEFRSSEADADERALARELLQADSPTRTRVTQAMYARLEGAPPGPALIEASGAEFTASRCRFVNRLGGGSPFDGIELTHFRTAEFIDCEIYNLGGRAIRARFTPRHGTTPHLVLSNCVVFASQPFALAVPPGLAGRLHLAHATIAGLRLVACRSGTQLVVDAQHNLLATRHWFSFAPAEDHLPERVTWWGVGNAVADPFGSVPADPTLPAWLSQGSQRVTAPFASRILEPNSAPRLEPADFRLAPEAGAPDLPAPGILPTAVGPAGVRTSRPGI